MVTASSLNPLAGTLVFLGAPIVILALIALAVYLWGRGPSTARPVRDEPPPGVVPHARPCRLDPGADGNEVHKGFPPGHPPHQSGACWTVCCSSCGATFTRGDAVVHFPNLDEALSVCRFAGWAFSH